jgi:hypothetical protein
MIFLNCPTFITKPLELIHCSRVVLAPHEGGAECFAGGNYTGREGFVKTGPARRSRLRLFAA